MKIFVVPLGTDSLRPILGEEKLNLEWMEFVELIAVFEKTREGGDGLLMRHWQRCCCAAPLWSIGRRLRRVKWSLIVARTIVALNQVPYVVQEHF